MGLTVDRDVFREFRDGLSNGSRIVFTNGCFDLLHIGHVSLLSFARSLGDALVVGINSDGSVRALKGPERPVVPQGERARLLAALPSVDFVLIFDELNPIETIKAVRPHIHVKGGDYAKDDMAETAIVEALGGEVVIGPYVTGSSTSQLIDVVRACHPAMDSGE